MKRYQQGLIIIASIFTLLLLTNHDAINAPYHWDAMGYVITHALDIYDNHAITDAYVVSHPPLLYMTLALIWSVFGYSIMASHLLILFLGAIGLYYTYRLASLYSRLTGIITPIILLASPLFLAQLGTIHHAIPLLAFGTMTLYYYQKKQIIAAAIAATLLTMTKETGILFVIPLFIHAFITMYKRRGMIPKKAYLNSALLIPVILLIGWFTLLWQRFEEISRLDLLANESFHFLRQLVSLKIFNFINYPTAIMSCLLVSALTLLIYAWKMHTRKQRSIYLLFISIFVSHLILFILTDEYLPRYLLPLYPFIIIIGVHSYERLAEKTRYKHLTIALGLILCLSLMLTGIDGKRDFQCGCSLESNLEYKDMIAVHMAAADYIMTHYPDRLIITGWPMILELTEPRNGYVSSAITATRDCEAFTKGSIVYYADQSHDPAYLRSCIQRNDLELLFRSEQDRKVAEIWG